MSLAKIISGGQTGVDQAALRAAQSCGLESGGWCPPGQWCESGIIPLNFPLTETPQERSQNAPHIPRSQRTEWNVRVADATLIFQPGHIALDAGTNWTMECAKLFQKPLLVTDPFQITAQEMISHWLHTTSITILNIAGPSEKTAPGIGELVYQVLIQVFKSL